MKLSKWAKIQGIHYKTAWKWFKDGTLPVESFVSPTGSIFIVEEKVKRNLQEKVVIYCRVSSQTRKNDLSLQVERCTAYTTAKGYHVENVYKEIASGMNDDRKELWKMIDSNPSIIIVESKDVLTRYGFNYLDRLLSRQNIKIEVINDQKL